MHYNRLSLTKKQMWQKQVKSLNGTTVFMQELNQVEDKNVPIIKGILKVL